MSETQQSKLPIRLRILFSFGDPLIPLCLLLAAILAAIAGVLAGRSAWTLFGIALAIAAIGFLGLLLLMALETLNGWASRILSSIVSLHDEEVKKLAASETQFSGLKLGSIFRN